MLALLHSLRPATPLLSMSHGGSCRTLNKVAPPVIELHLHCVQVTGTHYSIQTCGAASDLLTRYNTPSEFKNLKQPTFPVYLRYDQQLVTLSPPLSPCKQNTTFFFFGGTVFKKLHYKLWPFPVIGSYTKVLCERYFYSLFYILEAFHTQLRMHKI